MIDVEILNFQAIDRLNFTIEGFTALVGRSNIGKSSIVRALKCALTGSSSSDFVRHDPATCARVLRKIKKCECSSSVKITFDGDPTLLWEKGDAVNRYTVWRDGKEEVYDRVGRDSELPDFVGEHFSPVKIGSKHNLLQVSDQFDPLFLVDSAGTVVADTLSDLGQLDAVNKALALASKDRRDAASTRRIRQSDLETLGTELGRYAGIDVATQQARDIERSYGGVRQASEHLQLVGRLLAGMTRLDGETSRLSEALGPAMPDQDALGSLALQRKQTVAFELAWDERAQAVRGLMKALEPALPDVERVRATTDRRQRALHFEREFLPRSFLVERLAGVALLSLPDPGSLQAKAAAVGSVARWLSDLQSMKGWFDSSRALRELPEPKVGPDQVSAPLSRLRQVVALIDRWEQLEMAESHLERELETATKLESGILAEFRSLGLCPSCNQAITPVHLMEAHP